MERNRRLPNLKNYDIETLLMEVTKGSKLVCFGAGQGLKTFLQTFSDFVLEQYIYAIVDSSTQKQKTRYSIGGKELTIESPEILFGSHGIELPVIVLITSKDLLGIYEELNRYPRLMNSSVAFYGYVIDHYIESKINRGAFDCQIVHEDGVQIPKVIHYCWFGKSKIPDRYLEWMKSWKKYCPDYEIVEWNEDNYAISKHPYMAQAYSEKKWQFVSDYVRLDIIYQNGGVYLDTDVELIRSLDPLMHQQAFIGFESVFSVNSGLGFGAIPKHSGILALRNDYDDKEFICKGGSLNMTPCPQYQTESLARMGLKKNGTFQQIQGLNVYPQTFFFPVLPYNKRMIKHDNTFAIHHYAGGWIDENMRTIRTRNAGIYEYFEKE